MDLEEVGWGGMDWIDLARDSDRWRALASGIRLRGSVNAGNLWTS